VSRREQGDAMRRIGLARALSKLGHCSRSQAAEMIRAGCVRVNGVVRRNAESPVRLEKDHIEVNGRVVAEAEKLYLVMNKPRGVVTTASDEKGRETVCAMLPANLRWVAPVGRLDKASEGLLLFTNDSEWAARVSAPETHLDKTYHVQIAGVADAALLEALEAGVISDGETLRARSVRLLRRGGRNCWLEVVLDEGRNRQIRRMLAAKGVEVLRLVRVAIGPLELGELAKGEVRKLTSAEKQAFDRSMKQCKAKPKS
jgi:23S rRNA pseudouridine2605 synthase